LAFSGTAQSVGELTATFDVDPSPAAAGVARGESLMERLRRSADNSSGGLSRLVASILKLSVGVPAIAAVTAALGALVAGAAAAGMAVGAFQLAVKPQMAIMEGAGAAAEKLAAAEETAARKAALAADLKKKGHALAGKAAKAAESAQLALLDAQKAYTRETAGIPPATAQAALSLAKLKDAHEEWSTSLSGTTMPIFTRALEMARGLLPMLTPLVHAAASAFGALLDRIQQGVAGGGLQQFIDKMAGGAPAAIVGLATAIGNLARGFGGLFEAFLPQSGSVIGGLVAMTDAFADWAQALPGSSGLKTFQDFARESGSTLGDLAEAAVAVFMAMAPILGTTALLAKEFAQLIAATPEPVLRILAWTLTGLMVTTRLYAAGLAIVAMATKGWAAAQAVLNFVMNMNPIVRIVSIILLLAGAMVVAYQRSETFREIVDKVWALLRGAVEAAIEGIKTAISWLGDLPGKFGEWLQNAYSVTVGWLETLVSFYLSIPGRILAGLAMLGQWLWDVASNAGQRLFDAAVEKGLALLVWWGGLPGRAAGALLELGAKLAGKGREGMVAMKDAIVDAAGDLMWWLFDLPGKILGWIGDLGGLLKDLGRKLISGFINGIKDKFGDVKEVLGDLTGSLTSWKGPEALDKRLLTPAGRYLIQGFQRGIDLQTPALQRQLQGLTRGLAPAAMPPGAAAGATAGRGGPLHIENYYEAEGSSAYSTAEQLWFLKTARG
jgi:hypothetical protein